MKKVFLLVAIFLMGMTTQTFSQRRHNVDLKPGNEHRYYNSQDIRFVEDGVLYAVSTDGSFRFKEIAHYARPNYGRRVSTNVIYNNAPGQVVFTSHPRRFESAIGTNRYGQVIQIGRTLITYNRYGQVRSIGRIQLRYHKGRLREIGDMRIKYGGHGEIRDTKGSINHYNSKYWHDDWYYNNEGYWIDNSRFRKRR